MNKIKILVIGAGTIGLTYGWLLSKHHNVTYLIKPESKKCYINGINMYIKDLRKNEKNYRKYLYNPETIDKINSYYDVIMITVNRCQLKEIIYMLKIVPKESILIFMQNHWSIQEELKLNFSTSQYLIGFPQQVGGGRKDNSVTSIIFDANTRLGSVGIKEKHNLEICRLMFEQAGLKIKYDKNIISWLKVHYLQQSVTIGAILKAGDYDRFSKKIGSLYYMVLSLKEGLKVCKVSGVNIKICELGKLLYIPNIIITLVMLFMFRSRITKEMVLNHKINGEKEWIFGYYEVLKDGKKYGLDMHYWSQYKPFVDQRLNALSLLIK